MTDYISREEALHALCKAVHSNDGCVPCRNQLVSCRWTGTRTQAYAERILAIPAADVRPVVRGEWEQTMWFITCSVCGYTSADTDDEGDRIATNYCPNCGADMRKEEANGNV